MNRQVFYGSDFLYARPSFLEGAARSFDLFGVLDEYNYSNNGPEADVMALRADMKAIGGDFRKAYSDLQCQTAARSAM
jgi:hypothetical protein